MSIEATWICRDCKAEKPKTDFHRGTNRPGGVYPYCKPCNIARAKRQYEKPGWREHKQAYDRAYVERNAEKLKAQNKARYERNKPKLLEQAKAWKERNPEKRRLISQTYKHRRRATEKSGMTWRELEAWKRSQAKICYWCGAGCKRSYVVDHYVPLAKGGTHTAENLRIACRPCNARKSAKDPLDFAREVGRLMVSPEMVQEVA
jgi:5-methylcytosine-specific restriction endonuclease McrA